MQIIIPDFRCPSRNMTVRKHWTKYHKMKTEIFQLLLGYTKKPVPHFNKANITIEAHYKGKRCVDASNLDDKIIIDALMHMNLIDDDRPEINPQVTKISRDNTGKDELVITIEKV